MAKDFAGVVKKVADTGYIGVEPAGFPGTTPEKASKLFKDLSLVVSSAHLPMPLGLNKDEVLETVALLDCKRIVSGLGPDQFKTMDLVKQSCDTFNEASAVAVENGLSFGLHNHWWEFGQVDGRYVYQIMLELLDPAVFFEIDTYWVQTAGPDAAEVVRELGARTPLLHIKDGPCKKGEPMVAVGDGIMDFPAIVDAAAGSTEWMIVELDECATDMIETVEKSYAYLVGEGLARGNK